MQIQFVLVVIRDIIFGFRKSILFITQMEICVLIYLVVVKVPPHPPLCLLSTLEWFAYDFECVVESNLNTCLVGAISYVYYILLKYMCPKYFCVWSRHNCLIDSITMLERNYKYSNHDVHTSMANIWIRLLPNEDRTSKHDCLYFASMFWSLLLIFNREKAWSSVPKEMLWYTQTISSFVKHLK